MNMHISLNTILNDIHAVRAGLSTITKKKSKQNAIQTVRIVCLFHTFLDFCTLVDFPIPAFPACTSLDLVDCDKKQETVCHKYISHAIFGHCRYDK